MAKRHFTLASIWVGLSLALLSCGPPTIPKPRAYYRIELPEKQYRLLDTIIFPYRFLYPVYGRVIPDDAPGALPTWTNVDFPEFKARIHLTYFDATGRLDSLTEDSRALAYKHAIRADAIQERFFANPQARVWGILYKIQGNAASSWQFFATDSVRHFLRGALYFAVTPNWDSLAPVAHFFQRDLEVLMESIEWKD